MSNLLRLVACLFLCVSLNSFGALIGSETVFEHQFNAGDRIDVTRTAFLTNDASDTVDMFLGTYGGGNGNSAGPVGYYVNLNNDSVYVEFYHPGAPTFTGGGINGLIIRNDFLDINTFLTTATIDNTNWFFSLDRIYAFDSGLALDFQGMSFYDGHFFEISFNQPSPVPLPAGIYLFLSGLVGLGLMRGRNA